MLKYAKRLPEGKGVQFLSDDMVIRKTVSCYDVRIFHFMKKLLLHLISNPDPMVVPIYRFNILQDQREHYKYSYDMKRLGLLSLKERDLIDFVGDCYDNYKVEACLQNHLNYKHKDEFPELFEFLKTITTQDRYWDIHSGNILKDEDGYKIIDVEGFCNLPLEQEKNNWITRGIYLDS